MLKLKTTYLLLVILLTLTLLSCGSETSKQFANAEGFEVIEQELKSKFGNQAYYTDLSITYNESIGNIIGVTVAEAPESLKMEQWNLTQDTWKQNSEISVEVPEGSKASDFMFQLNETISLSTLGKLAETASMQLTANKNIENPILSMAFVKFPKNGDLSKTEYTILLNPEQGGTTYLFSYNLNGDLINMDY